MVLEIKFCADLYVNKKKRKVLWYRSIYNHHKKRKYYFLSQIEMLGVEVENLLEVQIHLIIYIWYQ